MALILLGGEGYAQKPEGPPRSILFTNGPAGAIHALIFSGDSQRLIASGRDKVTYLWDVGLDGANAPAGRFSATPIADMRWEISRANRGDIRTLAYAPSLSEIAIAGVSARNSGDIVLLSEGNRQVKTSLPNVDRERGSGRPGHLAPLVSIAYSKDGQQLASVSQDGEVLAWRPEDGDRLNWKPTTVRPVEGKLRLTRQLAYVGNRLIAVDEPQGLNGPFTVALYATDGAPRRVAAPTPITATQINAITADPGSDLWAVAADDGRVWLMRGVAAQQPVLLRKQGAPVRSLALSTAGLLAVGIDGLGKRPNKIELYNAKTAALVDRFRSPVLSPGGFIAIAFSPDGRLLASQDIATHQMLLWALQDSNRQPIAQPLSSTKPYRFGGLGVAVRSVAFAEKGYRLGFGAQPGGAIDSVFDFEESDLFRQVPRERWRTTSEQDRSGSWTIRPPEQAPDRRVVELRRNGQVYRIQLREDRQGLHACHAFIPGRGGEPIDVAIGTDSQSGVFLYRLPTRVGEQPELVRYYRDHSDRVTSLSVSADGKYLASGAMDQTIKVWPLAGAFDRDPRFSKRAAWGAVFQLRGGRVTLTDVSPEGIAFARGLRNGDVVVKIETTDETDQYLVGQRPAEILDALRRQPIYNIARVQVERAGKLIDDIPLVTPAWEPLMTLFAANSNEWAVWTPAGYFDSSLAEGGDLFGWQFNRGRDQPPRVVKGANLQKELERPDVIRRLLGTGSLEAALAAAQPNAPRTNVVQQTAATPDVRITSPVTGATLRDAEATELVAQIELPPGNGPDDFDIRASVGGRNLGPPSATQRNGQQLTVTWPIESFDPLNRIEVLATERDQPAVNALYASDTVQVRGDSRPDRGDRYKLHLFALACEKYTGDPKQSEFGPLEYTIDDVEAIAGILRSKEDDLAFYQLAPNPTLLRDAEVTHDRVEREIKKLEGRFSPVGKRDIVLVYLHGHGKVEKGEYYFVPTSVRRRSDLERLGIPWSTLAKIASRRCHVVWMIDTCESGVAAKAVRREATRVALREAQRAMTLAIAAVPDTEETPESTDFGGFGRKGGTAYAKSVLEAIDGQADGYFLLDETQNGRRVVELRSNGDTDRRVSLAELALYLRDAIPKKLRESGNPEALEPKIAPSGLLQTSAQIPLVLTK